MKFGLIIISVVGMIVMIAITIGLRLGKRGRKNVKAVWRL